LPFLFLRFFILLLFDKIISFQINNVNIFEGDLWNSLFSVGVLGVGFQGIEKKLSATTASECFLLNILTTYRTSRIVVGYRLGTLGSADSLLCRVNRRQNNTQLF
jgi:hypothetical protein